jgi:hypothetical protein
LDTFQAINCLATIIQSLRDKNSHLFLGQRLWAKALGCSVEPFHGQELASAKGFALEHDSLVNPTQNPEEP